MTPPKKSSPPQAPKRTPRDVPQYVPQGEAKQGSDRPPEHQHCLSLTDFRSEEIDHLIRLALQLKRRPTLFEHRLQGRWLLMLFQKTSTRTRLSFEIGMGRLGGQSLCLHWEDSNFAISPLAYESHYVSRQVDLIMVRLKTHADTQEFANHAVVPVINGCDAQEHPCQALGDLLTIYERCGSFAQAHLVYVGVYNNIAHALALGACAVGLKMTIVTPSDPPAHFDLVSQHPQGNSITLRNDPETLPQILQQADFAYTDTWVDMEFFNDPAHQALRKERERQMHPYQLNRRVLGQARPYLMHDMPIHPGLEIEAELVNAPHSLIWDQADNRLYAQQALMLYLLGQAPLP